MMQTQFFSSLTAKPQQKTRNQKLPLPQSSAYTHKNRNVLETIQSEGLLKSTMTNLGDRRRKPKPGKQQAKRTKSYHSILLVSKSRQEVH